MKFSIVVPVYFYNEFVENMLISVRNQTFTHFELVIVGNSISLEEFNEYQKKINLLFTQTQTQIKYIYTERKGGNYSRMLGAQNAIGEYVFFMDSDDQLVSNDVFSTLVEVSDRYHTDIISTNLQHAYLKDNTTIPDAVIYSFTKPNTNLHLAQDFETISKNFGTNIYARFIKRELLNDIHFLDLPYCQDWNVSSKIFAKAKTFYFVDKPMYYWIYREDSISRFSSMNKEKHLKSFEAITDILDFYKSNNIFNQYRFFLYDRIVGFCFQYIYRSKDFDINEGFERSNKLLNNEIKFDSVFFKNKRTVVMYFMVKIRPLFRLYLKYYVKNNKK